MQVNPDVDGSINTFDGDQIKRNILYLDEDILVVNKPAGITVIPDGYNRENATIADILTGTYGSIWIVHRLDKQTSGALIFARTKNAHRDLCIQFESRKVKKEYHAIVSGGRPVWSELKCTAPLRINADRKHRTKVDIEHGKPAKTIFYLASNNNEECSLIIALPHSGYTHQIRAHLSYLAKPIINDILYGAPNTDFSTINRIALHAFKVSITHPTTNDQLSFLAPYPQDFSNTITALGLNK